MPKLSGKKALVTGASTGIGESIAIRFAREGAHVAINYLDDAAAAEQVRRKAEEAAAASQSKDAKFVTVQADISDEQQVLKMFETSTQALGSLDILVNNAGIQKPTPSDELSLADFERILSVNVRGTFLCSREAIRHFLSRKASGIIVNNSSVHQIIPKPLYLSYSMSKAAIGNLTRTLALEFADRGIRVNSVGPGATVTPINSAWTDDPKARAVVESHIPMGRAASADEIASVFVFLASEDSSYVTGQTIYACGGLTLYPEFRTAWSSGE